MDEILQNYIEVNKDVLHGKPCFRGTRIPVYVVLELLEGGVKPEEIAGKNYYPELSVSHIRAALHYAAESVKNQEYVYFLSAE